MPWHEVPSEMNRQCLINVGDHEVVELLDECQKSLNVPAMELVYCSMLTRDLAPAAAVEGVRGGSCWRHLTASTYSNRSASDSEPLNIVSVQVTLLGWKFSRHTILSGTQAYPEYMKAQFRIP